MNQDDFQALRLDAENVFASLYLIDAGALSAEQRKQHQEALAAAYLTVVKLENTLFEKQTSTVKKNLAELKDSVHAMQQGLSGLKSPTEKLDVASKGVGILATVAQLLS